jgi:hypothetical protein
MEEVIVKPGEDLKAVLERYKGLVIAGSGILRRVTIGTAQRVIPFTSGPYELIVCSGRVPDVRIVFCDLNGRCRGGKLRDGTIAHSELKIWLER